MNIIFKLYTTLAFSLLVLQSVTVDADSFVSLDFPVNRDIADDSSVGLLDSRSILIPGDDRIVDVDVRLEISARDSAWNGDLYAYLRHDSGFTVLLNRPGRRTGDAIGDLGYSDNGLSIVLDDEAPSGDIHSYRLALFGDHKTPIPGGLLDGSWVPDARDSDPDDSLLSSPRSLFLDQFDGADPDGSWLLFVADLSAGGTARLDSWSLDFTLAPIPESSPGAAGILGILLLAILARSRRSH